MCGLFGSVGDALEHPEFRASFDRLRHRGPDDTELVQPNGTVTLAFQSELTKFVDHVKDDHLPEKYY